MEFCFFFFDSDGFSFSPDGFSFSDGFCFSRHVRLWRDMFVTSNDLPILGNGMCQFECAG